MKKILIWGAVIAVIVYIPVSAADAVHALLTGIGTFLSNLHLH